MTQNNDKATIFALHPIQEDLIKKFCFDECGKILIGGIKDKELGCMFPCAEENCPYEKDRAKEPIGDLSTGQLVIVRALKKGGTKDD